uniref:Uncharacterized protein n=1 Tax=Cannabis sativa TaxID=3483 RepID=A0A803Q8S9_CANSA
MKTTPPILRSNVVRNMESRFGNSIVDEHKEARSEIVTLKSKVKIDFEDIAYEVNFWQPLIVCHIIGANPPLSILGGFVRTIWKDSVNKLKGMDIKYLVEKSLFEIVEQIGSPLQVDEITKHRNKLLYLGILIEEQGAIKIEVEKKIWVPKKNNMLSKEPVIDEDGFQQNAKEKYMAIHKAYISFFAQKAKCDDPTSVQYAFLKYYQNLLGTVMEGRFHVNETIMDAGPKISWSHLNILQDEHRVEEVKEAILSILSIKSVTVRVP